MGTKLESSGSPAQVFQTSLQKLQLNLRAVHFTLYKHIQNIKNDFQVICSGDSLINRQCKHIYTSVFLVHHQYRYWI